VTGPAQVELTVPIATDLPRTVMMNLDTLECVDVSGQTTRDSATLKCRFRRQLEGHGFYLDPHADGASATI